MERVAVPCILGPIRDFQLIYPASVVHGPNQISDERGTGGARKECRNASEVVLAETRMIVAQGAVRVLPSIRFDTV